jgi:hypothetical protein
MSLSAPCVEVVTKTAEQAGEEADQPLADRMQYVNASQQAPSESAKGFERQIQFGFHCKEPKEDLMKRNLTGTLSLVVLSLMLTATGAYAQSELKATVPFAFKVGQSQLPGGTYEIRSNADNNTITIRNSTIGAMSLARREGSGDASPRLVFNHVGGQYFLSQIWGAAGNSRMNLPSSKLEEELQMATAGSNSGEKVIVALK